MKSFFVYLLRCADNSLYCGYTINIEERLNAHNFLKSGAKYTKTRRPVKLVYFEEFQNKTDALKREYEIKNLKKEEKEKIIEQAVH